MKLLIFILFVIPFAIFGQESTNYNASDSASLLSINTYKFNEVSVVDSRSGVNLYDLGKQVEIISQEEIKRMPVNSVDELLRYIPGVEIQSRGMFGTQADISMRGGTYNQTLVLIDGIRIGDPMTGHFNSNLPVSLSAIERIEIIKGASSVIYGADAVGGVINIVTKNINTDINSSSDEYKIGLFAGQFSTFGADAYGRSPVSNNISIDLYYNHAQSYGYPAFDNTHNYSFDIHTTGASAKLNLNDTDILAIRFAADYRDFDARYFYTASSFDKSKEQVNRLFGQTYLRINSFENHSIVANLGIIRTTDDFVFNPAFTPNSHKTVTGDLNIHDQISLGKNTAMTIGTELQFNNMRSNDRGNRNQQQLGLYAVGIHDFSSDFNINAGLRGELLPTGKVEIVPSIGTNYFLSENVKLRANAGRSIRTPDYTERYVSTGLDGVLSAGRNLGNPDLLPEISWNYEVGTDIRIAQSISLNLTGYLRDSKNIIDYGFKKGSEIVNNQNLDPTFDYLYAQNLAKLQVRGVEFKISGYETKDRLRSFNWYFGGNILDISVADDISSKYITNAAGLNFSAGLFYILFEELIISTDAIYCKRDVTDDQSIEFGLTPEYFVIDAKLTYKLNSIDFDLTVKNLFDREYSDILGVQLPGRWIMFGVSIDNEVF